jgi:tellurite resistance protein
MTMRERTRLAESVAKMAVAIADGECRPSLDDLAALAHLCTAYGLQAEAARIRRWMTPLPLFDERSTTKGRTR